MNGTNGLAQGFMSKFCQRPKNVLLGFCMVIIVADLGQPFTEMSRGSGFNNVSRIVILVLAYRLRYNRQWNSTTKSKFTVGFFVFLFTKCAQFALF